MYSPYLRTAATLPWEISQVHDNNFHCYQPKGNSYTVLNNIQFICTTSLSSSSITTSSVQNVLLFIHTGLKSLPSFVNSIIHSALWQATPCVDRALSQIGHVSNWRLIHNNTASWPIFDSQKTIRNEFRSLIICRSYSEHSVDCLVHDIALTLSFLWYLELSG